MASYPAPATPAFLAARSYGLPKRRRSAQWAPAAAAAACLALACSCEAATKLGLSVCVRNLSATMTLLPWKLYGLPSGRMVLKRTVWTNAEVGKVTGLRSSWRSSSRSVLASDPTCTYAVAETIWRLLSEMDDSAPCELADP